ncbi:serine/threonine-protein phosphatase 7 long form-like protein, partial [Trifolium medium]|nr:serine/threonine-protein phosphatase 7 long form-like protein [Trifolium medium]
MLMYRDYAVKTYLLFVGPTALSFLYRELSNATVPKCKYLAGYATLLQAWIYHHFKGIGGEEDV